MKTIKTGGSYWLLLVHFFMLLPLALPVGTVGGKPVDLVYSDALLVIAFFYMYLVALGEGRVARKHANLMFFALGVSVYFLAVSVLGAMAFGDTAIRVLSALRFLKPFLFSCAAYMVYRSMRPTLNDVVSGAAKISVLMVVLLLLSDVFFNSSFPSSRWGGNILGVDVYGFPNSPSVFYAFYVFFSMLALQLTRKYVFVIGVLGGLLLIMFMFSRSGWIAAIILLSIMGVVSSVFSWRAFVGYISVSVLMLIMFWVYYEDIIVIIGPWMYKIDTLSGKNITLAGRQDIWRYAVDLILQKPFFGYSFEPFSHYVADFDTPHQQYLEVAYKAGLAGLFVYLSFYLWLGFQIVRAGISGKLGHGSKITGFFCLAIFLAILASNFAQPSISYSVLGNALVFYFSLIYFIATAKDVRNEANSSGSW